MLRLLKRTQKGADLKLVEASTSALPSTHEHFGDPLTNSWPSIMKKEGSALVHNPRKAWKSSEASADSAWLFLGWLSLGSIRTVDHFQGTVARHMHYCCLPIFSGSKTSRRQTFCCLGILSRTSPKLSATAQHRSRAKRHNMPKASPCKPVPTHGACGWEAASSTGCQRKLPRGEALAWGVVGLLHVRASNTAKVSSRPTGNSEPRSLRRPPETHPPTKACVGIEKKHPLSHNSGRKKRERWRELHT